MDRASRDQWINTVLNEVFLGVIAWEPLRKVLIFKGARILNLYLGESRQSLDIDSNSAPELVLSTPNLDEQAGFFEEHIARALRRRFEQQNPVKFHLVGVEVDRNPPNGHFRGWNAFVLRIRVRDNSRAAVLGLPTLDIDVAAPEALGPKAIVEIKVDGIPARVYALHRIAGEKLRAYLTSLPAYRSKMRGGKREFRVKDLHDLARILAAHPVTDAQFWVEAGREFQLACESRLVDCRGLESFLEYWPQARERYEADASLSRVPFTEAEQALRSIVGLLEGRGMFPLEYPV